MCVHVRVCGVCMCVVCEGMSVCCDFSYFRERAMTVLISFVPETAYAQGEQLHVHVYRCCNLLTTSGFL